MGTKSAHYNNATNAIALNGNVTNAINVIIVATKIVSDILGKTD
jgi:hypothetical protein